MSNYGIVKKEKWNRQVSAKGTVGSSLDVTPASNTNNNVYEMVIHAPLTDDDCTLKIYKDSVSAANLEFDGYMANRNADGAIILPSGSKCTTKWIVVTSGGSGDLFAMARYE